MATSIGQYAPVFLPGGRLSLTKKPRKPQSTGSVRVGHYRSHPECLDVRHFFACGNSAPGTVESEGSCLPCRDPGGTKCAGTRTASATGVMALSETFSEPLVAGDQKVLPASISPKLHPFRHLESFLTWGPSLLFVHQTLKGAPLLGSYSIVQYVRHLMSQPLYCSAVDAGVWGERVYGDGSTPYS